MADRLSSTEIENKLKTLDNWAMVEGREAICKSFAFKNFSDAWAFMTRAALLAEKMNHHPEWFNVYNRVEITLSTHSVGGLSDLDIQFAEEVDSFLGT